MGFQTYTARPDRERCLRNFVIPACEGAAFEVYKGEYLKIIEIEGKQVADFNAFNTHNFQEKFSASLTRNLNGNLSRISRLYSAPPFENLMFEVVADTVRSHWLGGRCCKSTYMNSKWYDKSEGLNHKTCQNNLASAIKKFGLSSVDVHDVFAIFQKVVIDEDHNFHIDTPISVKGDYIELKAEIDTLVAISACPSDKTPTNDFHPKPLGIEISEQRDNHQTFNANFL